MAATSTAKQKTYRLFKIASELNIGRDTIVEFLLSKGFEVPNKATSKLTDEMYDLVMNKFEKEHRQIEKQRRKVDAYHERRTRSRKSTSQEKEIETEEAREVPQEAPASVEVEHVEEEQTVSDEKKQQESAIDQPDAPEAELPVEQPETLSQEPETETADEETSVEEPAVVSEETIAEPESETEEPEAEVTVEETPVREEESVEAQTIEPEPVTSVEKESVEEPILDEADEEPVLEAEIETEPQTEEPDTEEPDDDDDELEDNDEVDEEETEDELEDDDEEEEEFEVGVENKEIIKKPKLKGLSVVGKIDISKQADSTKAGRKKRKKRKRIRESKSVDITAESGSNKRTTSGSTGSSKSSTSTTTSGQTSERRDKRKRKRKGVSVNQDDVQRAIRETFSRMDDRSGSARQKRSRQKRGERLEQRELEQLEREENEQILQVAEYATVAELANLMDVDVTDVISKCIGLGLMVSINQRLDKDTIQLVADEFNFAVEFQEEYAEDVLDDDEDPEETLKPRAPIVTIMGHVDHGKTSLLDHIRSANVVAGEAGGITQHIGAYSVEVHENKRIAFLDTPGHEAFTAMRARGAQVTDIVILIVAADDSVMPQTIEAISHAQAAGVPMVVAINKIDKPEANPERIKQQLADRGVLVESWGGKHQSVELSAKQGINIDKLMEAILLEAEILDLRANPDRNARGTLIEAEVDKGRGAVATVLVQKGTLKVGDPFVAGQFSGRVRAMMDERGQRVKEAGPSTPVQLLGLDGVPDAGDAFVVLGSEQEVKEIALRRQQLRREQGFMQSRRRFTLDDISKQIALGDIQELPLIIKGDVNGSVEALADELLRLSTSEVQVSVVMKGVGEITESDVLLAAASNAIILGFHVRPNLKARKLAESEGVDIRTYRVIYETVNEVRAALEGMLTPEEKEEITATIEVRDIFKISRIGTIAGCYVQDGRINRNDKVRLLRDGFEVYDGSISSLKRHKDDVREVEQGYECGISLENMNDLKVGDIIEAYRTVEIKRTLDQPQASSASDAG